MYNSLNEIPHLNADTALVDNIWQWLLWRQGVAIGNKANSIHEIANRSLGLHAARLSSPFVTVMVRASDASVSLGVVDVESDDNFMTLRCMRKTLHTLPIALATLAHGATAHFRERDALRYAFNHSVESKTLNRTIGSIISILEAEGSVSHRDLELMICNDTCTTHPVRVGLKVAWERGLLVYKNASGVWDKEKRMFALSSVVHPDFNPAIDRKVATNGLVYHYFDRYGPATIKDAMWWSGLSRGAVVEAILNSGVSWTSISSPWSDSPMYMLENNFETFNRESQNSQPILNFLAHEDVALKAYFETRKRYLGNLEDREIFNQIGEVLPSIVYNGRVAGKWTWDKKNRRIDYKVFKEFAADFDYQSIEALKDRYTAQLDQAASK